MVRKVKNKTFYHVNSFNQSNKSHKHSSLFKIGDTHKTNKQNALTRDRFKNQQNFNWFNHYNMMMLDLHNSDIILPDDLEKLHTCLKYYRNNLQELFFEQIRKDHYPNCPSRIKCLWVSESLKESRKWYPILNGTKQIVKLELTGTVHKVNEGHFFGEEILSRRQMFRKARSYWSGQSGKGKEEILFEGKAKIIDIIP